MRDPREPCQNKTSVRRKGDISCHGGRTDYRVDGSEPPPFTKTKRKEALFIPTRTNN